MKTLIAILTMAFLFCASNVSAEWIVEWEVVDMILIPCPESEPVPDEYGRMPQSNASNLVACWDIIRQSRTRNFDTLEEAEEFVQRGKDSVKGEAINKSLQNFLIRKVE